MLLTPLFLIGLLGIGIPIWLHRLETQTTEREKFSSTRFLEASKKRIHVQRKLKYLLLMAARILFFTLLVFAFARPILFIDPQLEVTEDTTHHIIVLDTSFSMNQNGSFAEATSLAQNLINAMSTDDIASIYTASAAVTTVAEPSDNQATLLQQLDALEPDNGRLDLGAMVSALDGLIETSQANFILHVVGDFQQTGQAVRFADMIPDVINGRPVSLDIQRVTSDNIANWAVSSVIVENRSDVSVGISGFNVENESGEKTLTLSINGVAQQEQTLNLNPESGISFITFEEVVFEEGDNRVNIQLSPADALAEDDLRYTVFDNSPPAPVLLLTEDLDSLGVTYISAALETAPRGYEVIPTDISDLDTRILQRYPWLVIEDIGIIDAGLEAALLEYVNAGGSVLAASGERSTRLSSVPVMGNDMGNGSVLGPDRRGAITMIDTSHPALSDGASWNTVNVRTLPVEINVEDRVLIAQNAENPVLLERIIGAGRFMLLTTSLDNSLSDLPVKPVFVSFMAEVAQHLSNENLLVREQVAESFLQLARNGGTSGQVFDPDGESLLSLEDTTQEQNVQLNKTGYYQVFTPSGEVLVAVNPDIRESDLTLMQVQALQNWQNRVAGTTADNSSNANGNNAVAGNTIEADQEEMEVWRLFLILLAVIVLAESLLSNRYLSFKTGTS